VSAQLYDDAILALAKARHGHGRLTEPAASVTRDNPLCGDRVTVDVRLAGGRIAVLAQITRGCVLTQAAASLLGRRLADASVDELERASRDVRAVLAGETVDPVWPELGLFTPVQAVRSRHECVLLPFDAAAEALAEAGG
jgi:nitrogen fixation NifU-like protein